MSVAELKVRILGNLYGRISLYAERMPDGRLSCCGWPHPGNPLYIQRGDDAIAADSVIEVVDHLWEIACERFTPNQIRAAAGFPECPPGLAGAKCIDMTLPHPLATDLQYTRHSMPNER